MKKVLVACAALLALSVVAAYAAWMTNVNHHAQVRIPDGWNTQYEVMVKEGGKQAHIILANDSEENTTMVAAIASMEIGQAVDLDQFKAFFEKHILQNPTQIESERRGFNNLKGIYVIYDAKIEGQDFRLMCFFTQHEPYFYAVFTGTMKDNFQKKKHKLDEVLVTFQYVEKP